MFIIKLIKYNTFIIKMSCNKEVKEKVKESIFAALIILFVKVDSYKNQCWSLLNRSTEFLKDKNDLLD